MDPHLAAELQISPPDDLLWPSSSLRTSQRSSRAAGPRPPAPPPEHGDDSAWGRRLATAAGRCAPSSRAAQPPCPDGPHRGQGWAKGRRIGFRSFSPIELLLRAHFQGGAESLWRRSCFSLPFGTTSPKLLAKPCQRDPRGSTSSWGWSTNSYGGTHFIPWYTLRCPELIGDCNFGCPCKNG
jgi:hypothetical protein